MIKAVIFDWDGVIVDSMPLIAKAIKETAQFYKINVDLKTIENEYFQPREKYYETLGIEVSEHPELPVIHSLNVAKHHDSAPLFKDTKASLKSLHKKKVKLSIASNSPQDHITQKLKDFKLEEIFREGFIMGAGDPKKEKLQNILSLQNVKPEDTLYIGDLPSDITVAKKVGVKSAGIARQKKFRQRLKNMEPDYLLSSLKELDQLIQL